MDELIGQVLKDFPALIIVMLLLLIYVVVEGFRHNKEINQVKKEISHIREKYLSEEVFSIQFNHLKEKMDSLKSDIMKRFDSMSS